MMIIAAVHYLLHFSFITSICPPDGYTNPLVFTF
nr:MAG TPA: hypothetical protein [Caudoviricetes sp.]